MAEHHPRRTCEGTGRRRSAITARTPRIKIGRSKSSLMEAFTRMIKQVGTAALGALALLLVTAPALAATPTETLKAYGDVVLKILDDPAIKARDRKQGRR